MTVIRVRAPAARPRPSSRSGSVSFDELAAARAETARYRQLVVDIENNAPSPLMRPRRARTT